MTAWNDPQWIENWYQLLEHPQQPDPTDRGETAVDSLLENLLAQPTMPADLRQEALADWACHQLLQSYYQAINLPAGKGLVNSNDAAKLPQPRQAKGHHPECSPTESRTSPAAEEAVVCIAVDSVRPPLALRNRRRSVSTTVWVVSFALSAMVTAGVSYLFWFELMGGARISDETLVTANSESLDSEILQQVPSAESAAEVNGDAVSQPPPAIGSTATSMSNTAPSLAVVPLPPLLSISRVQSREVPGGTWLIDEGVDFQTVPIAEATGGESWKWTGGRVDLELDGQAQLRFRGPALVRRTAAGNWVIDEGTVLIKWFVSPAESERVAIASRGVELRTVSEAVCFLTVEPSGETLVQVTAGDVQARSLAIDAKQPWNLKADQRWQAHFWPSAATRDHGTLPAAPGRAVMVDRQGNFEGLIDVGGQVLPWGSPTVFGQVLDEATTRMEKGDQQFVEQWGDWSQGWQQWQQSQRQEPGRMPPLDRMKEFDEFMKRSLGPLFQDWEDQLRDLETAWDRRGSADPVDRNRPPVVDGSVKNHQTRWGALDGKNLLIEKAEEFERPLRSSER